MKRIFPKIIASMALLLLAVFSLQFFRICFLYAAAGLQITVGYLCLTAVAVASIIATKRYRLPTWVTLIVLVIVTLTPQLLFSFNVTLQYETDLQFYFNNAVSFITGENPAPAMYQALFPTTVTFPLFLVPFLKLFDLHRLVPIFLNHLGIVALVCATFLVGKRFCQDTWALAAAFLIALHPIVILYANTCNAELLFGVLVMLALFSFWQVTTQKRLFWMWGLLSAALCGFANWFRPLGILMLAALIFTHLFFANQTLKRSLLLSLSMVLLYVIIGVGTNAAVSHVTHYDPPKQGYGWNLYIGASPNGKWNVADSSLLVDKMKTAQTPTEVQQFFAAEGWARYREMGVHAVPHVLRKIAPWYAASYVAGVATHTTETSPTTLNSLQPALTLLISFIDTPLFLGALLTCFWILYQAFRGQISRLLPVVFYLLASFLALGLLEIAPRYTISYRPFFCLLTVYGVHQLWTWHTARQIARNASR